ncbi:MAG: cellulase family glycosylhydrolase [Treponema sp.]|jgi:hypothetical protein|nr:cellulase family glycosylhydrolase [Treponema sp.]
MKQTKSGTALFFFAALSSAFSLALLLASCASASFAVPESRRVPEDFFGISPDRTGLREEYMEKLDEFGAVWIRTTIHWNDVEPEEGQWRFDSWDEYVDRAEAANKKIMFILGFDNPWLYGDRREHRDLTEREIPYFLKYVEQVVGRYRDRVAAWEIWNEPDWVFWNGSDEHFFALSAAAAKKIRETDPRAVILAGATSRFSKRFTRGLFDAGAMEHTDGFSIHPYGVNPLDTVRQIDKLQKLLDEYGYDKPIWISEVGYSTGPISFCPADQYPSYIVKTLSGLAARGTVRNAIWYELMNDYNPGEAPDPLNPLRHFGLIYPDRTHKPGAGAFALCAGYLAGAEYRPELPLREGAPKNITALYFRAKDGTNVLFLWNNHEGAARLRLAVDGTAEMFRHDIQSGRGAALAGGTVLAINREPVVITWTGEGAARIGRP